MKSLVIGVLAGAGLVMAAMGAAPAPKAVFAQPGPANLDRGGTGLIALTSPLADGKQQLLVIDRRQRVVGVYHVDPVSGAIVLKGVRNIHWDLQMIHFNGASPLPQEIRSLVEQR